MTCTLQERVQNFNLRDIFSLPVGVLGYPYLRGCATLVLMLHAAAGIDAVVLTCGLA